MSAVSSSSTAAASSAASASTITIRCPDDFHLHVRDGPTLVQTVPASASSFSRAIIMPNLQPPVSTAEMAAAYRSRILAALPSSSSSFQPLMTLYLTSSTTPSDISSAASTGFIYACKLYPAGATTHSSQGINVNDPSIWEKMRPVFEEMEKQKMLLLIHSEVTDPNVDLFDRESVFIKSFIPSLLSSFPSLRIVLEHITTASAVSFILSLPSSSSSNLAATITAHHLLYNRNIIFAGGINPHYYCLPVLKRETDRERLLEAATSGDRRFFAGTDSAPHARGVKECERGCAGCYTAPAAVELYAEAFDSVGKIDQLQAFLSENGALFYGLPLNQGTISLKKESWTMPKEMNLGESVVVPFRAGMECKWKIVGKEYEKMAATGAKKGENAVATAATTATATWKKEDLLRNFVWMFGAGVGAGVAFRLMNMLLANRNNRK